MRVLIAAGGTGGHLYPALAVARVLRERGHDVTFVGGEALAGTGDLESRLVPDAGFDLRRLPARGLPSSLSLQSVRAGWALARSLVGAWRLERELRPAVVLGMGGYPSAAPALAAGIGRLPVVLHEQNARLVLAHRMSMRAARTLALSLPLLGEPPRRRRLRVEMTGNPIRTAVADLALTDSDERAERREAAAVRLGLDAGRPTVLAFGGSQGAIWNAMLPDAVGGSPAARAMQILHLTGPGREEEARPAWEEAGVEAAVRGYLDTMQDAYACADLVVCRAGATTLAELSALGLPALLIPLPTGVFQQANARVFERMGAAAVVAHGDGFVERLRDTLERLCASETERRAMAAKASELGRPDAAERLAGVVEAAAGS